MGGRGRGLYSGVIRLIVGLTSEDGDDVGWLVSRSTNKIGTTTNLDLGTTTTPSSSSSSPNLYASKLYSTNVGLFDGQQTNIGSEVGGGGIAG